MIRKEQELLEKKALIGYGKLNFLRLLSTDVLSAVATPVDSGSDDSIVDLVILALIRSRS